jgi:uncharacterized protein YwgA
MNKLVEDAILVALASRLSDAGSWTGETHVQKAAYLMSELAGVDFDFGFILYKHGPFSFDLRDELSSMRADGLIESRLSDPRYGPSIVVTDRGRELAERLSKTMERYSTSLDWITQALGRRGVVELERLATAMWMTRQHPGQSVKQRAEALVAAKPHISLDEAIQAVEEIDDLLAQTATGTSG